MKLQICYSADYQYAEKVSLSPHALRIFPRQTLSRQTVSSSLSTPSDADRSYGIDLFGNDVASLFFPHLTDIISIRFTTVIETPPTNPFHFLLEQRATQLPVQYDPLEKQLLAPYLIPQTQTSFPEPLLFSPGSSPADFIVSASLWLHQNIAYEAREEGDPFTPSQTLLYRKAACRDFAVLMAEVLRANGLAARLISGYLWEGDAPAQERVAAGAFHAWTETFLPGAGWIGIDSTNGVLCDHHAIATAVGLTHAQIAPVSGFYYGSKTIPSKLQTHLTVSALPE